MSTSRTSNELPSSLGKDTSKWGKAWVCKIMNQSSNRITFVNPYKDNRKGEIAAGKQDSSNTPGWIPLSSTGMQYEVSYYNTSLRMWSHVGITDPNREWMLAFKQAGVVDECEVHPAEGDTAEITLIFNDEGYKFQGCGYGDGKITLSSLSLRRYPR